VDKDKKCTNHPAVEEKYILCRRESDRFNEVIKAGPKAPSAGNLVDFKSFIEERGLLPIEVANFLKITCAEVDLLMKHISWIEPHARDNLLLLLKVPVNARQYICRFLLEQDGHAGMRNVPAKAIDSLHDF